MKRTRVTKEIFISRSREKHGDKYDYSKVEFKTVHDFVEISCPLHGYFSQKAYSHLQGIGCKCCGAESSGTMRKKSRDKFIEDAKNKHGNIYGYDSVIYVNTHEKIKIKCEKHGYFEQTPHMHLSGQGCPTCNKGGRINEKKIPSALRILNEKLIPRGIKVISFCERVTRATFACSHGHQWETAVSNVLNKGSSCPKCANVGVSSGEDDVCQMLSENGVIFTRSNRDIISPQELDIVIPSHKVAIEYNGLHWHSDKFRDDKYHISKRLDAESQGYRLISVRSDLWESKREILMKIILNAVGRTSTRIYARKSTVMKVSADEARMFLNTHHVQGYRNASQHWGLISDGEIVAVMSVTHWMKKNQWELVRYATSCNVVGGLSKLWKHVASVNSMKLAFSYVDRDLFTGESYSHAGFIRDSTSVGFRIVNGKITESRQKWNNAPNGLTQNEWYEMENVQRIYDSGQDKLIWSQ